MQREKKMQYQNCINMYQKNCRLMIYLIPSVLDHSSKKKTHFWMADSSKIERADLKFGSISWTQELFRKKQKANVGQDLAKVSIVRTLSAGLVEKLWKMSHDLLACPESEKYGHHRLYCTDPFCKNFFTTSTGIWVIPILKFHLKKNQCLSISFFNFSIFQSFQHFKIFTYILGTSMYYYTACNCTVK